VLSSLRYYPSNVPYMKSCLFTASSNKSRCFLCFANKYLEIYLHNHACYSEGAVYVILIWGYLYISATGPKTNQLFQVIQILSRCMVALLMIFRLLCLKLENSFLVLYHRVPILMAVAETKHCFL